MMPLSYPFFLRCSYSSNISAKCPEIGAHVPVAADFKYLLNSLPAPHICPREKQLSQHLPEQLQVLARLCHCLTITENPQLLRTEWDLLVQDLPPCSTGLWSPEPTRGHSARGLHPHPAPKARSRWSCTTVRKQDKHGC